MCSRGLISDEQRYIYNDLSYSLESSGLQVWIKQSIFMWSKPFIRHTILMQALTASFIIIFQVFDFTFHVTNSTSSNMMDHLGAGIFIPIVSIPALIFSAFTHGYPNNATVTVAVLLQMTTFGLGAALQILSFQAAITHIKSDSISNTDRIWGIILYTIILLCNAVILLASIILVGSSGYDLIKCGSGRKKCEMTAELV